MNFGAGISLLLPFGVSAQRSAAPLPVGETGGSKGKGGGQGGGSPTRQGGSEEPSCTPDLIRGKDGETPAAERAKPAIPSAREGRSPFRIWQPACTPVWTQPASGPRRRFPLPLRRRPDRYAHWNGRSRIDPGVGPNPYDRTGDEITLDEIERIRIWRGFLMA
jgi:hypothetical protein